MFAVWDFSSIGTALAMIAIAFMQFLEKRKSTKRDKASSKRDEVVQDLKKTSDQTAEKVEAVHKLVNGGMHQQLLVSMISAQTLFQVTKEPEHGVLAEVATSKYKAHLAVEEAAKKSAIEQAEAKVVTAAKAAGAAEVANPKKDKL